jgi:hypothetical protein
LIKLFFFQKNFFLLAVHVHKYHSKCLSIYLTNKWIIFAISFINALLEICPFQAIVGGFFSKKQIHLKKYFINVNSLSASKNKKKIL